VNRRRTAVVTGIALAGAAGAAGWGLANGRAAGGGQAPVTSVPTSTAAVVRTTVAERQLVSGTLGHAGTYNVTAGGPGTLTRLPAIGSVVERGQAAYEVDGVPVILMYGSRPAWRAFRSGMTDGTDVRQLEANLRALGYGSGLTVDRHFSSATYWAIHHWQSDAHLPVTGTVPLGQIAFVPAAVRIGAYDLTAGARVQPHAQVEHGTGDQRAITVQLPPAQLPRVHVGDSVIVTLPDGTTRTGRVSVVGAVAVANPSGGSGNGSGGDTPGSEATAPITITVKGRIQGFLDQAQVQVAITSEAHKRVLAVPITALRALSGGRYEVLVDQGGVPRHVPVTTGLFDETAGLAEVSGTGLAEGQRVEVPRDGS
jgi:peptidoglycan hydrolase-like protein with peptidoglycan-binding domain